MSSSSFRRRTCTASDSEGHGHPGPDRETAISLTRIVTDDGEYLYQVTETEVVHQDDLQLTETDDSTITLVTCVPRMVYDHRMLVTGKLAGVKRK